MQRLISKYGLAAHLAILAVAPLFLFPFCSDLWVSRVLLWLSLFGAVWVLMAPSRRADEMLHEARQRVVGAIMADPLFWLMLTIALYAFLCALNDGVAMAFDAEASVWSLAPPKLAVLPGCVSGEGALPFATAVAALVLVQGCRQALGKSARQAFALMASALAGCAALAVAIYAASASKSVFVLEARAFLNPSFAGVAFGLYFLASLVALVGIFELKWKLAVPLILPAVGGTAIGLFHFAPAIIVLGFAGAAVYLLVRSLLYIGAKQGGVAIPKCLALLIIALLLPVLFVVGFSPAELAAPRLQAFSDWSFFSTDFEQLRSVLGTVAEKVWREYPWRGSGIGSFGMDIRFFASPEDWSLLAPGQEGAVNGWWQVLAERGIVGTIMLVLPMLFLLYSWFARLGRALRAMLTGRIAKHLSLLVHPLGSLGLIAFALVGACGLIEHSFWRPETFLATVSLFALAGSSFPMAGKSTNRSEKKEEQHG